MGGSSTGPEGLETLTWGLSVNVMKDLFLHGPLSIPGFLRSLPVLFVVAGVLTLGFLFWRQLGQDSTTAEVVDVETGETRDLRIVSLLPKDAIAAIDHPSFVNPAEAAPWMEVDEQVIGLSIGGDEKAYPIRMLSRHEIVNDTVGGKPVAITW